MTAGSATRQDQDAHVQGSEHGLVLGVDLFGPFSQDIGGYAYAMQGVEVGHTNYGMIRLLKDKTATETTTALQSMRRELATVQGPSGKPLALVRVHSDQGTEFSGEFAEYLLKERIQQTNTGGYRPTNNSRVERRLRMVLESFRACLHEATGGEGYYDELWGVGLVHANACVNRATWGDGTCPYEALAGKPWSDAKGRRHVFGAKVEYHVKKERRGPKWQTPGQLGIWVGMSDTVLDGHVVVPIKIDRGAQLYKLGSPVEPDQVTVFDELFPLLMGPDFARPDNPESAGKVEEFLTHLRMQMYGESRDFTDEQVGDEDPLLEVERIVKQRGKGKKAEFLVKWVGSLDQTWEPRGNLAKWGAGDLIKEFSAPKKPPKRRSGRRVAGAFLAGAQLDEHHKAVEELISKQGVKGTVEDWLPGYSTELSGVIAKRLQSLSPEEWERVAKSGEAVRLRMILEPKADGRKKGRLICQGFREPKWWDKGPVDSPVASLATIRTLIFMCGAVGDILSSIDISTAFLQAESFGPDEPKRFVSYQGYKGGPISYWRLTGPLYGQRSASLRWHRTVAKWLVKGAGFDQGVDEPCAFTHPVSKLKVVLYVDDLLVRGTPEATRAFYAALGVGGNGRFEVKDPNFLTPQTPLKFVGFTIGERHQAGGLWRYITQREDVCEFLEELDIHPARDVGCPMPSKSQLFRNRTLLSESEADWCKSVIGSLNFLAQCTRYDIAHAVSRVSAESCKCTVSVKQGICTILAYLKSTSGFEVGHMVPGSGAPDVVRYYSDSDHAGERNLDGVVGKTRSCTGMVFLLNNAPVHWRSVKQRCTAPSPASAEIYALHETVKQARLFSWRAKELGIDILRPLVVQVDNKQAKTFCEGTCVESKLRGTFSIKEGWVQELKDAAALKVEWVKGGKGDESGQLADLFTKCFSAKSFVRARQLVCRGCLDAHQSALLCI